MPKLNIKGAILSTVQHYEQSDLVDLVRDLLNELTVEQILQLSTRIHLDHDEIVVVELEDRTVDIDKQSLRAILTLDNPTTIYKLLGECGSPSQSEPAVSWFGSSDDQLTQFKADCLDVLN